MSLNIDKVPLTVEDVEALSMTADILYQYKGAKVMHQFEDMVDMLGKMVNHLWHRIMSASNKRVN